MKRKLLSIIMVAEMILMCVNFGYAKDAGIDVSAIENKFAAINITLGDVFQSGKITRGDYARLMVNFLNLQPRAAEEKSRFVDVGIEHNAVEEINCLYDLGYVSGVNVYNYAPDRNITYAEALSVIVNAYGYKYEAQKNDNWQNGILNVAYDLDLLDGVSCDINEAVQKAGLLKILDNALEADVRVIGFDGKLENVAAVERFYDIYTVKGIMTGNNITTLTQKNDENEESVIYIEEKRYVCNQDYSSLLGREVKCYYKEADGELMGLYVEQTKKNESISLIGDDIQGCNETQILYSDDSGRLKKVSVENPKVIYNGVAYTGYGQMSSIVFSNTDVELLDNDGDRKYEVIFITEYVDYLVSSVDLKKGIIYDGVNNRQEDLNSDSYDVCIYDENGEKITVQQIEEDVVLSVAKSKNTSGTVLKTAYVVKNTVSGKVTSISDDLGYKISEVYYKKSPSCTQNILLGQNIKAYIGKSGKIVARTIENEDGMFAVLFKTYEDPDAEDRVRMRFFTQNGDFEDYFAEEKVRIDNSNLRVSKAAIDNAVNEGQVVILESEGDKIKKIRLPQSENSENGEFRMLASGTNSLSVRGNNGINVLAGKVAGEKGKTAVMLVPSNHEERDAYGVFDFAQIENMRDKTYEIYTTAPDKLNMADLVVLYDAAVAVLNDDSNIYVVEKKMQGINKDEEATEILTLSSPENGTSLNFEVSSTLDLSLTDGYQQVPVTRIQGVGLEQIERGDIVSVATDATGKITRIQKIYDYNEPNNIDARFKLSDNLVDTCHYYPNKYVDMSRLVYTKLDAVSENFLQFVTSIYPTSDDWKDNTNVGWQKEIAIMNEDNILAYDEETNESKRIKRSELDNYIGKNMVIRINQCLLQEVIIYE